MKGSAKNFFQKALILPFEAILGTLLRVHTQLLHTFFIEFITLFSHFWPTVPGGAVVNFTAGFQ